MDVALAGFRCGFSSIVRTPVPVYAAPRFITGTGRVAWILRLSLFSRLPISIVPGFGVDDRINRETISLEGNRSRIVIEIGEQFLFHRAIVSHMEPQNGKRAALDDFIPRNVYANRADKPACRMDEIGVSVPSTDFIRLTSTCCSNVQECFSRA